MRFLELGNKTQKNFNENKMAKKNAPCCKTFLKLNTMGNTPYFWKQPMYAFIERAFVTHKHKSWEQKKWVVHNDDDEK